MGCGSPNFSSFIFCFVLLKTLNLFPSKEFTLLSGEKVTVSYMSDKSKLKYTHQGDYRAIEKPYTSPKGKELSMVFILPEDPGMEGLQKTLKALKPSKPNTPPFFLTQLFEAEVPVRCLFLLLFFVSLIKLFLSPFFLSFSQHHR